MIVQNSGYNFNHKTRCQSDVGERLGTTEGQGQRNVESVLERISPQIGKSILITCFGNQADALISDGVCALMWSLSMHTCNQSCVCQVLAHVLGICLLAFHSPVLVQMTLEPWLQASSIQHPC